METHRHELRQANFMIPAELLEDLRKQTTPRQRSRFVAEALRLALLRRRFVEAVQTTFGMWKDHPELRQGTAAYLGRSRRSGRG